MAVNFTNVRPVDGNDVLNTVYDVKANATAINQGDIVIVDGSNPGYVAFAPNGTSNTAKVVGIANSDSTQTASVNGTVSVSWHPTGLIATGTAATPGNLAQAVINTFVTLDASSTTQTIDENDTTNGFMQIVRPTNGALGFNTTTGVMQVIVPCNIGAL